MRSSNKSRSRNKNSNNNRRGNTGNIVNRVFDSAGPEGKVRGTPQQIIEKYQSLSHDALMSGDRIASENFAQYAEHYTRLLGTAQREIQERREAMEAQQRRDNDANEAAEAKPAHKAPPERSQQPDVPAMSRSDLFPADKDADSNLVQTPENAEKPAAKKPAPRKRKVTPKAAAAEAQPASSEEPIIN